MKEFKYVVTDAQGIHARPAGILVKAIAKKISDIKIKKAGDTREVNAKSIMDNAPAIAEPTIHGGMIRSGSDAANGMAPSVIKERPITQFTTPAV